MARYTLTRARSRQSRFKAWGSVLLLLALLLLSQQQWIYGSIALGVSIAYLLWIRLTPCRVETNSRQPCRWTVRGFLGTCDYHTGRKRGLPHLVPSSHRFTLPVLMWPREARLVQGETQPKANAYGMAAATPSARETRMVDQLVKAATILAAVVAVVGVVRDFVSG